MTLKYCAVEADLDRYMEQQDAHENYLGLTFDDKTFIDDFWKQEGEYYDEFTTPYEEVN